MDGCKGFVGSRWPVVARATADEGVSDARPVVHKNLHY